MSVNNRSSIVFLVLALLAATAGAFCLEYFVLSAPTPNRDSVPSRSLSSSISSANEAAFVFDEPEIDLGVAKGTITHRFTYRNTSSMPLTITNVRPSCRCVVSQPDHPTLQPGESGSISLETDISQKPPGAHRFRVLVEYECGDQKGTATAEFRLIHQPDLYITPRHVDITATEGTRATATITVMDYRKESLKICKIRSSTPNIEAKIIDVPKEYMPGWRHVIEATYTDAPKETRRQFTEHLLIETSDPQSPLLTISFGVHRLERLRLAPQAVLLQTGNCAEVILRDSLGEKLLIAECETNGLVACSFTKEEEFAKKLSLSLPPGRLDGSKYPATIWIRVSKPCQRRLPIRVSAAAPKGS